VFHATKRFSNLEKDTRIQDLQEEIGFKIFPDIECPEKL
jgi:hypothetical protein